MNKAKTSSRRTRPKPTSARKAVPSRNIDLTEIRQQITELVANRALAMVETMIDEAGKGQHLGMKYLFEMIGLYPTTPGDDAPVEDSMAAILLRRLGLPETPLAESGVTKDPGTPGAATEDVLE